MIKLNSIAKFYYLNLKHSFPDFIIIGAPKSGTTSLFHYLSQHPDIIPPKQKEPGYFCWNRHRGLKWYLSQFPLRKDKKNKLTFEATPSYLFSSSAPERIAKLTSNVKFIIILRDPIERAYSHWNFYHNSDFVQGKEMFDERSFEKAIEEELEGKNLPFYWKYLAFGLYAQQILRWQNFFRKDNFLILDFDELKSSPIELLNKCITFLKISDYYTNFETSSERISNLNEKARNENEKLRIHNYNNYDRNISLTTYQKLKDYYRTPNSNLSSIIDFEPRWII